MKFKPDALDAEINHLVNEIRTIARKITARTEAVIKLARAYHAKWRKSRD